jgi:cysteine desulfurase
VGTDKLSIYLDNLAQTPADPRVTEWHAATSLALQGNSKSAEHAAGHRASSVLESAKSEVGNFVGRETDEVLFTPSASSALWLALRDQIVRNGTRPLRVVASAIEHSSLLEHLAAAERQGEAKVQLCPVEPDGRLDMQILGRLCRAGVDLVCVMAANNETGVILPVMEATNLAHEWGARVLVDASQAAGKLPIRAMLADVDLIVLSGAKFYGPRGVGVLAGSISSISRDLGSAVFGTPDAAAASAMALACSLRESEAEVDEVRIASLRDTLQAELLARITGLVVNGASAARIAGALHVSSPHIAGKVVVARLWGKIDVSTGAPSRKGLSGPSHVLSAMRVDDWVAEGAVRICVGRFNDAGELAMAADLFAEAMNSDQPRM